MENGNFDDFKINEIDINFVERMLKSLPSNIYFKDMEGKYVFCTHYWNHINTPKNDPTWTIRSKYDIDIRKDKENAIKAMEEDKRIFATKKGTSYEIKFDENGQTEYMQLIKNPVFDDNGNMIGIVGLINDITRTKLLEDKLERMATLDSLTGVRNRSYMDIWIEKNKNLDIYPLTVIVCDCNGLKRINDHYGHLVGDRYIIKTAEALMTCKPENASVIRAGGDEFMVFMPNTSEAEAAQYMEKVQDYISNIHIFDETLSIAMGSSTTTDISKRLEDLISLADKAMYIQKEIDHKRLGIPSR